MRRGKLFTFSRFFVRLKLGRWRSEVETPGGPAVFVCSHTNLLGPLATLCWMDVPVRPWVLHVFTDRESCRRQYRDFTFPRRLGLPRPAAAFLAWWASGYVSALMKSLGAIPVFRGTAKLGETFRETIAALQAGDWVLVFPDVDYTDEGAGIGQVYDGFLLVDRMWRKVSREPLDFVPLALDVPGRRITAGAPVRFDPSAPRRQEMVRVREALRAQINGEA